ncbi:glycoprotease family-domain-containing protein [Glomus cerebriforme]|uniref:N(6)-L-threonylcarbamoyladenine synthase n=1 Tax=Glomus cerebriforme TaxID=658196 RepID=A0A397T572_9GLOM|nr:glycoprotease family-domain-containing protein [Glomus cerebriforme]
MVEVEKKELEMKLLQKEGMLVPEKENTRETRDDAIGECLDKSAILLGYNYPGGPVIEKLALTGQNLYQLPFPKNDSSLDFSFSGLKSKIGQLVNQKRKKINFNNLACSLQFTLAEALTKKLKKAWLINQAKTIIMGGGVIANQFLRAYLTENIQKWNPAIAVFIPPLKYCTDNAAMIGILAYYKIKCGKKLALE